MVPLEYNTLMRSCHLLPQIFKNVGTLLLFHVVSKRLELTHRNLHQNWLSHSNITQPQAVFKSLCHSMSYCFVKKRASYLGLDHSHFFWGTGSIIVSLPNSSTTNKGFEHYLFDATLWSLPPPVNGHFRNRFIGGTYHIFLAYFLGLCFWRYTPNLYGQTYGTVVQYLQ